MSLTILQGDALDTAPFLCDFALAGTRGRSPYPRAGRWGVRAGFARPSVVPSRGPREVRFDSGSLAEVW